jgi:hypothetical protein
MCGSPSPTDAIVHCPINLTLRNYPATISGTLLQHFHDGGLIVMVVKLYRRAEQPGIHAVTRLGRVIEHVYQKLGECAHYCQPPFWATGFAGHRWMNSRSDCTSTNRDPREFPGNCTLCVWTWPVASIFEKVVRLNPVISQDCPIFGTLVNHLLSIVCMYYFAFLGRNPLEFLHMPIIAQAPRRKL